MTPHLQSLKLKMTILSGPLVLVLGCSLLSSFAWAACQWRGREPNEFELLAKVQELIAKKSVDENPSMSVFCPQCGDKAVAQLFFKSKDGRNLANWNEGMDLQLEKFRAPFRVKPDFRPSGWQLVVNRSSFEETFDLAFLYLRVSESLYVNVLAQLGCSINEIPPELDLKQLRSSQKTSPSYSVED